MRAKYSVNDIMDGYDLSAIEGIRKAEVVLGLDHKGNVTLLKSRFFSERINHKLSINDTVDYFSHFVSH